MGGRNSGRFPILQLSTDGVDHNLGVTNTPDPLYFTVWPCINSTRLLVLVSVESVHLPFLEVQSGYQLIPNLQKRQMDRLYGD